MRAFWSAFQDCWIDVYKCSLPTAAAINGHAIAGGAILPTTADYKVMVDNPKLKIGLNEAKFGLVAPPWFVDSLRATVGHRYCNLGCERLIDSSANLADTRRSW